MLSAGADDFFDHTGRELRLHKPAKPSWWKRATHLAALCRGFKAQYGRYVQRICQTQQLKTNTGKTSHQTWGFNMVRSSTKPSILFNTFDHAGCQAVKFLLPSRIIQNQAGLKYRFQISQVAMTQAMTEAKT